jgi:hypothetical protein
MAISATFYLDAPSLGSATVIYSDINLTTIAPDGFYSDGVIVRQQVSGVLLPQVICEECQPPVTYNCVEGTCIDPGDGTGTYATLAACQAVCGVPPPCECHDGIINDNNAFSYYDCDGVLFAAGAELGSEICYNINAPHSSNITDVGPAVYCVCGEPPPVSYNCIEGTCIDPGNGSGTYATLAACQAACGTPPPVSYDCIEGSCIDPGDGSGTYATLEECEAACGTPPPVSYNCVEGICVNPGDGSGTYATLAACQAACGTPPPVSYNCVDYVCVDPGDGSGTYATLAACQSACVAPVSYICADGSCEDPGDGSGPYPTLAACLAACGEPPPVSYNCVEGTCVDPGDGSGTYATLAACEAACGVPPVSYNCVEGTCIDPGDGTGTYGTLAACEAACEPPCNCHDGVINDNNSFSYYDCSGELVAGGAELGSEICFDVTKATSGNITDLGPSAICSCS